MTTYPVLKRRAKVIATLRVVPLLLSFRTNPTTKNCKTPEWVTDSFVRNFFTIFAESKSRNLKSCWSCDEQAETSDETAS